VRRFELYPLLGQSSDGLWYQIELNNNRVIGSRVGWISADFAFVRAADGSESLNGVPVTFDFGDGARDSGYVVRPTVFLNLRVAPRLDASVIGEIIPGLPLTVLGRTEDSRWFYIGLGEARGWVAADLVEFDAARVDYGQIVVLTE
jgi:uncharacterized protein YgiM (DUF1202 family)